MSACLMLQVLVYILPMSERYLGQLLLPKDRPHLGLRRPDYREPVTLV